MTNTATRLAMVERARTCLPVNFRYSLGCGGWEPTDPMPCRLAWRIPKGKVLPVKALWCDCSGFISWVIGLSRKTTIHPKLWGISTVSIHRDATGPAKYFRKLADGEEAEPGDFLVYPDRRDLQTGKTKQGHVGLISAVNPATGWPSMIIDCGSSTDGISERPAAFMLAKTACIVCRLV